MDENFKNRVEILLKLKGITQRQFAEKLGVSEVTVSRWLTLGANGRNPSVPTVQKISEVLATTPDYLLGKEKKEKKTSATSDDGVNLGELLAGTPLTATAVIAIVALAKAMGKLNENDKKQIETILNRE